jgi:hypothetical protein
MVAREPSVVRVRQLIDSVRAQVRDPRLLIDAGFVHRSLVVSLPNCSCASSAKCGGARVVPGAPHGLTMFGNLQSVSLRSPVAGARFRKGVPVHAVRCEIAEYKNNPD